MPFFRFVKRAARPSLNRMWHHFSLDDPDTKISGVFCPAPGQLKRAALEVHGRVEEMWKKIQAGGKNGVHARRHWFDSRKAADNNAGVVQLGACSRFQLQALLPKSDQRALSRAVCQQHNSVKKGFPFHFVDIINYLIPDTSYKKWVKP